MKVLNRGNNLLPPSWEPFDLVDLKSNIFLSIHLLGGQYNNV